MSAVRRARSPLKSPLFAQISRHQSAEWSFSRRVWARGGSRGEICGLRPTDDGLRFLGIYSAPTSSGRLSPLRVRAFFIVHVGLYFSSSLALGRGGDPCSAFMSRAPRLISAKMFAEIFRRPSSAPGIDLGASSLGSPSGRAGGTGFSTWPGTSSKMAGLQPSRSAGELLDQCV